MSLTIIEINDSEIRSASKGEIISRHPGYAVLKPDRIETGMNAWKISRTNPRETVNKYWSQLNQDSLIVPSRLARHNADLAYAQLMTIHEESGRPEEVVFVVPGSYNREQLALLLGIVEACPFRAVGLVDSAVAGTSAIAGAGEYLYLDIHLHYTVLTMVDVTHTVFRKTVKIIDNAGISEIYDSCAEYFADLFIDQTRFDPLHHAETEQALYNLIPDCLEKLDTERDNNLEIEFKSKQFQAKFSADNLLQKLEHHYDKIYREVTEARTCLISDRLDILPGFSAQVENRVLVDEKSVFNGALSNLDWIISKGEGVSLVTELPAAKSTATAATTLKADPRPPIRPQNRAKPTHILLDDRAYLIEKQPVYISGTGKVSRQKPDNTRCRLYMNSMGMEIMPEGNDDVFINSKKVSGTVTVNTGDTISFSGSNISIKCIEVL